MLTPRAAWGLARWPQDGATPLHYAAYAAKEGVVIELLRAGCDTSIADGEGKTALMVAQENKLGPMVALITNGPPPEVVEGEEAAEAA